MFTHPSRRTFLRTTAATLAALILPRSLLAEKPDNLWFLQKETGNSWPVANPVLWSLENAGKSILERAKEGLLKLTSVDGDRIIRLVTRRCKLNLLELHPGQVVVHHWGPQALADLRPWFKVHGLARKEIEVVVLDRKKEIATVKPGDDFLYGERLAGDWPLALFQSKWDRRFKEQPDDWSAAPTRSGFPWAFMENNRIPWSAMKSAWRRSVGLRCLNCDHPTLLVNFGYARTGMFNRFPRFIYVCGTCLRAFKDDSVRDVGDWIRANLDEKVWPGFEMTWERQLMWKTRKKDTISS